MYKWGDAAQPRRGSCAAAGGTPEGEAIRTLLAPALAGALLLLTAFGLEGEISPMAGIRLPALLPYVAMAVYVALWFVAAWFLKRAIQYALSRERAGAKKRDIPKLLFDVIGVGLYAGALIGVVGGVFDKSVDGLLTTSGILAGVLAFALRHLISDIFSGIALAIEKPFKVGDWLQFGAGTPPETGRVVEMNWRATRLVTVQGRTQIFPNSVLAGRELINLSLPERYFRTVKTVCIDFSVPPNRAVEIILSAIKATPGVVESQPPLILIDELNSVGMLFSIHFWVPDYPAMFLIERGVMINVMNFLNQAGYAPAYPKNEIDLTWRHRRQIVRDMDVAGLLRRVSLFKALKDSDIDQLKNQVAVVVYPANATIVRENEQGDSLFVVVTGLVKATVAAQDGEKDLGYIRPGEVFGEMSLLTGSPRTASVITTTETAVIEIKHAHLRPILAANHAIIDDLGDIMSVRVNARDAMLRVAKVDHGDLDEIGLKHYLTQQIARFFGVRLRHSKPANGGARL